MAAAFLIKTVEIWCKLDQIWAVMLSVKTYEPIRKCVWLNQFLNLFKLVADTNTCIFFVYFLPSLYNDRVPTFAVSRLNFYRSLDHVKNIWSCTSIIRTAHKEAANPLWICLRRILSPAEECLDVRCIKSELICLPLLLSSAASP